MLKRHSFFVVLIGAGVAVTGCGPLLKRTTVASATEIFQDGQSAYFQEGDLQLAEQALASHLKLLEVLIQASPDNADLLVQASQGFGAYTFAFVEDKIAKSHADPQQQSMHRERARRLYLRGRDYGLRALALRHEALTAALTADLPTLQDMLNSLATEDVPSLFWATYGWAGAINVSRDRPEMVGDLPRVVAMMHRALELDEAYFHAGPHVFFGVYYAARSPALGGSPSQAKFHLDRALDLTKGDSLLVYLFIADPYAVQIQDRALFEARLQAILDAPEDLAPEQRLMNQVAKVRARVLLERMNELFL